MPIIYANFGVNEKVLKNFKACFMKNIFYIIPFLFIISSISFSQSNEENSFIRLVSGKTIVPLEFSHVYLEFSKDGKTVKLNNIYQTETEIVVFRGMERDFAVYRIEEDAVVVFKYLDDYGLGMSVGTTLQEAIRLFILIYGGRYMS